MDGGALTHSLAILYTKRRFNLVFVVSSDPHLYKWIRPCFRHFSFLFWVYFLSLEMMIYVDCTRTKWLFIENFVVGYSLPLQYLHMKPWRKKRQLREREIRTQLSFDRREISIKKFIFYCFFFLQLFIFYC